MASVYRFPEYPIKHSKKPISFLVSPTNGNGTEYYSNIIARCFWDSCGSILYKYSYRNDVYKIFYYWSNSVLYPKGLKDYFRNFSQVLYSLVHEGNVCKVIQSYHIEWSYNPLECPPKYLHWDYNLKSELGRYIHADTPNDFLYASKKDIVISNSRLFAKKFYLEMGHLLIHLDNINDLLFLYVVWLKSGNWETVPNHYHILSNLQYYLQVCQLNYETNTIRWFN